MKKFTPGPWEAGYILVYGPANETVATCDGEDALAEANARFIACAPEMWDLLDRINGAFYSRTSKKEWLALMELTKPLLRKAEGRDPCPQAPEEE